MSAKPSKAVPPNPPAPDDGWAPHRARQARLAEIEALLAQRGDPSEAIGLDIERAGLLSALNRRDEAKLAFIAILRNAPTNFDALNQFGALLTEMGAIDAACRVYAEAILHHPQNPAGHVNLANLLLRATRYHEARGHYERALAVDPDHAPAHQGLGAVLSDLGDRAGAGPHFRKGFRGHAISTLPYRGDKPPLLLLQLVSSGGGNIPTGPFLDDTRFETTIVVADHLDSSARLPPHQLIFNAIGDADLCEAALEAACRLTAKADVPVINDPRAVMKTGRIGNAARLRTVPGVRTARTIACPREMLAGTGGARALADLGFIFPLLLRSPGYHTGRNFIRVDRAADLAAACSGLPGEDLLAIEYLDARGKDGSARKYRVMMIDGELYPLHLAISRDWKVHYFTSDMAQDADHRAEEATFLQTMTAFIGDNAMRALLRIRDLLGLDYAGIDFGLDSEGTLLLFEANAAMVVARPNDDPRWAYRRAAIDRILQAVTAMIETRAGTVEHFGA
jgi:hypothetical protein